MKLSSFLLSLICMVVCCFSAPAPASADSSHVRIVRLNVVEGEVRFTREFHGDSLTDPKALWETAPLNLPIREGYVLSTGRGRAEVEFETGAMAFLGDNTVVEFYDLSLNEGAHITRLVLRQGTGSFFVSPVSGDYFSVTGGDFTVESTSRSTFRLDNFDNGSTVEVLRGEVGVIRRDKTTPLGKGQSVSARASDPGDKVEISRAATPDDFDKWVSGRIDSTVAATSGSSQYINSSGYTSGYSDLYTYGSWFSLPGYGFGWRPFGAGLGWSPFDCGSFYFDPVFGWSFLGSSPWGWLPYHYGGWLFSPGYGWVWTPTGGGTLGYRPVTAVFVRSGGTLGMVPAHPADARGKTPLNLREGFYPVEGNAVGRTLSASGGEKWSVVKQAPRETFSSGLEAARAPAPVSRSMPGAALSRSALVYDSGSHRFVNPVSPIRADSRGRNAMANTPAAGTRTAAAHPPVSFARPALAPPPARGAATGSPRFAPGWTTEYRGSSGSAGRASGAAPAAGRAH